MAQFNHPCLRPARLRRYYRDDCVAFANFSWLWLLRMSLSAVCLLLECVCMILYKHCDASLFMDVECSSGTRQQSTLPNAFEYNNRDLSCSLIRMFVVCFFSYAMSCVPSTAISHTAIVNANVSWNGPRNFKADLRMLTLWATMVWTSTDWYKGCKFDYSWRYLYFAF